MTQLSNTDANGELQIEDGIVDEKQPLNNGIADRAHIIEADDQTDDVHIPRTDNEKPAFFQKSSKRKYRTYDTGKRNCRPHKLASPLTASGILIERRLKEKTGLTRIGLILAILCVLLSIALIVCIILLLNSTSEKKVCVKPSCLRASAEILSKMNQNQSPCVDFRGFACENWFTTKPLPKYHTEWNMKDIMLQNYHEEVHKLLMRSSDAKGGDAIKKMKNFYDSCLNSEFRYVDLGSFKLTISKLGGWSVYEKLDSSWNQYNVLEKLHAEHNISPFFRIDVSPDPMNASHNIIYLKPPSLTVAELNIYSQGSERRDKLADTLEKSYVRFIKDILRYFGATHVEAIRYSDDILKLETRLADILVAAKENKTQSRFKRLKLRELDHEFHPLQFYNILTRVLMISNSETTVLVENPGYFSELPHLITSSSPSILNAYMIWRYVAENVPYLSDDIAETYHLFKTEITDKHEVMPRWEFCINTLHKYAGFFLLALFENQTTIEEKEKVHSVVNQIFSETSSIVAKNLMKLSSLGMQQKHRDRLSQVKIQIGLPSYMFKKSFMNEYYDNYLAFLSDFQGNVENGGAFITANLGKKLKHSQEEDRWLDNMISMPVAITYNAASNYIVVPWPVLQEPYFDKDYLSTSLYGGIGVEMAKAFVQSVLPDSTGEDMDKYLSAISQCVLGKNFTNLNLTDTTEFTVTLTSLKLSYEALMEKLSLIEDIYQPVMESFKKEELFFISFAQSICTDRTDKGTLREIFSKNVNDLSLTNTALFELPEFTELYSCNRSSKYSSSFCVK